MQHIAESKFVMVWLKQFLGLALVFDGTTTSGKDGLAKTFCLLFALRLTSIEAHYAGS